MHTIIGVLCFASREKDALDKAKITIKKLTEKVAGRDGFLCPRFDYCILFDRESTVAASEGYYDEYEKFFQWMKENLEEISGVQGECGRNRYGDIPHILDLSSEEGRKMIETAIGNMREEEKLQRKISAKPWCSEIFSPEGERIKSYDQFNSEIKRGKGKRAFIVPVDVHLGLGHCSEETPR